MRLASNQLSPVISVWHQSTMGKKASSSADDPNDEWEPVDYPEPTNLEPHIRRWRQLCRLLLNRLYLRALWHEMGMWLKRLKERTDWVRALDEQNPGGGGPGNPPPRGGKRPPRGPMLPSSGGGV